MEGKWNVLIAPATYTTHNFSKKINFFGIIINKNATEKLGFWVTNIKPETTRALAGEINPPPITH